MPSFATTSSPCRLFYDTTDISGSFPTDFLKTVLLDHGGKHSPVRLPTQQPRRKTPERDLNVLQWPALLGIYYLLKNGHGTEHPSSPRRSHVVMRFCAEVNPPTTQFLEATQFLEINGAYSLSDLGEMDVGPAAWALELRRFPILSPSPAVCLRFPAPIRQHSLAELGLLLAK